MSLTSPMRGRGSSNHCVCVCLCVIYRSSERYECYKSQSKVPTEGTQRREQNERRNWTKNSWFESYDSYQLTIKSSVGAYGRISTPAGQ